MRLIVGLGNHPLKYAQTRHNFGFIAIEKIAAEYGFSPFKYEAKYKGSLSYGQIKGQKTILLKPHTLMNLSGHSAQPLMQFYKIEVANLWVISDDLDQEFGACRLREKGSDGGQKGLRSIAQTLGTQQFYRLKFGINNTFRSQYKTDKFVLGQFTPQEKKALPQVISQGLAKLLAHW